MFNSNRFLIENQTKPYGNYPTPIGEIKRYKKNEHPQAFNANFVLVLG